jgi:hypothetical protein
MAIRYPFQQQVVLLTVTSTDYKMKVFSTYT